MRKGPAAVYKGADMPYLATFFSHFGATRFRRLCRQRDIDVVLMPVPRSLSSSCGTCARFDVLPLAAGEQWPEEVERVVSFDEKGAAPVYTPIYTAEGL